MKELLDIYTCNEKMPEENQEVLVLLWGGMITKAVFKAPLFVVEEGALCGSVTGDNVPGYEICFKVMLWLDPQQFMEITNYRN